MLLMAIEATSALARLTGYALGRIDASMVLMNAVNLVSRALMAFVLPAIGLFADLGRTVGPGMIVVALQLAFPIALLFVFLYRRELTQVLSWRATSLTQTGSLFGRGVNLEQTADYNHSRIRRARRLVNKRFLGFLLIFGAAMTPHYTVWGLLIILVQEFPDYRATFLALTSVFNGMTVLILSLYFDPMIVRFARSKWLVIAMLETTVLMRIWSALLSVLVLASVVLALNL